MTSPLHGRTSREQAIEMLQQAEDALQQARQLVTGRPTRARRIQAFRLLSGVEGICAGLKIALDV